MGGQDLDLCQAIPNCPLCKGTMVVIYDRPKVKVCACVECHTSVTVPAQAWSDFLARRNRQAQP